jgi:hypothetical protein
MTDEQPTKGTFCPLIKKDCVGLQCNWFMRLQGTNPNTGAEVDEWACSIAWVPLLLIENSRQQINTSGVINNFRTDLVAATTSSLELLAQAMDNKPPQITGKS